MPFIKAVEPRFKNTGGGKLARSETLTVRLDPKLRYLAELAARKQRRTVSSFVEWAIDDSLSRVTIWEGQEWPDGPHVQLSISDVANVLWDVDPADRFAKLALRYPYMLDHTEQIIWKLVSENGWFWSGKYAEPSGEFTWARTEADLMFSRLREKWDLLNRVARGEELKAALPLWKKNMSDAEDE